MNRISNLVNKNIILSNINSWLDIGTGNGVVVNDLNLNHTVPNKYACDIDIQPNNVLDNKWKWFNDYKVALNQQTYNLITLFDVIEHFDKEDGIQFLKEVESKTEHIILFTPEGFLQQDNITHPGIKPGMIHKSGWYTEDFIGYNVINLPNYHYPQGLNKWFNALLVWK